MDKAELQDRTKEFARRCLKLCQALPENWMGKHLRSQLFRSATSVAANYRSACSAQSIRAFLQKLGIVVEEIDESMFWIEFIADEELISQKRCQPLLQEAKELTAIFIASQKTTRRKNGK
ncbi:MAG: four helix bundle protein [Sedimentisphaerales bacterium]|nr:four helix bundle protein [Sedimentisphaerales bacterium]